MAWCGCSRKGRQSLASSGGGAAGWSVSTSTPYILWRRRSSMALRPFSGDMYGWVFCAKNWQREVIARARALEGLVREEAPRTESHRTLTAPVVHALLDAELFYLMVPAALVLQL